MLHVKKYSLFFDFVFKRLTYKTNYISRHIYFQSSFHEYNNQKTRVQIVYFF